MDLASKMSDTMEIEEWDNGNGLGIAPKRATMVMKNYRTGVNNHNYMGLS
jgi:hypothetical protein